MTSYRRSIYIGLGGLGVQVISKVKKLFKEKVHDAEVLPMIKYLGIDTDDHELQNSNLNNEELVFLRTRNPMDHFLYEPLEFSWMPDENKRDIYNLKGFGSGQNRSNGRFALELNRNIIYGRLQRYYDELEHFLLRMANILNTPNIDIHVVSSIAGGTGSGIVIEMAKIIKKIIPNSNVMGYFFSDSFFQPLLYTWNVKANAYATLFELNFEMSSSNRPFDTCVYIDNKTKTNSHHDIFVCGLDEAINCTAKTMCVISSFGNSNWSFFDDAKVAMASGFYNQTQRIAWITSIGSCAISYNKDKINYFIHYSLALRLAKSLLRTDYIIPNEVAELCYSIRESLINLENSSDIPLLHSLVNVDEGGSINDERLQSELSRLESSFRNSVLAWGDKTKLQISKCIFNLLQRNNTVSLPNVRHALSELLDLIKMFEDTDLKDKEELLCQNNQLEHELNGYSELLREKLYHVLSRIMYRAEIANLKEKMIDVKYRLLKNEYDIRCKYRIREALSDLQTYCEEEMERINTLIQTMRNLSEEIDANLNNYLLANECSEADINVTPCFINQLDIDKIRVNWDVVRTNLFETSSYHNICREYLIQLISQTCEYLDYNDLLVNIENVEEDIYNMLRKSEVLLNVDYKVIHDESLVISAPLGLDQFINNIVANRLNIKGFIIVQGEENEIRAYKTAFLFTPHSISGLNVNESFANSNEASVIETLKKGRYSPFTDKNYQNLYNATKGL